MTYLAVNSELKKYMTLSAQNHAFAGLHLDKYETYYKIARKYAHFVECFVWRSYSMLRRIARKITLFVSDTSKNTSGVSEVFYIGKCEFYALQ